MRSLAHVKRGFTLIELLVVIAIIAILAAILFPVFAQAKVAAKKTAALSNFKQTSLGVVMYEIDSDDVAPVYYPAPAAWYAADHDPYHGTNTWVGLIFPYVKNEGVFFDATLSQPAPTFVDPTYGGLYTDCYYENCGGAQSSSEYYTYLWQWVTNISLNSDGYDMSGSGTCDSPTTKTGFKPATAIDQPANRMMLAPTTYGTLPFSWMYFNGYTSSWPYIDIYYNGWSWTNGVWDSRKRWGAKMSAAYADGHVGKFGREKFVGLAALSGDPSDATSLAQYCAFRAARPDMDEFWGQEWSGN